MDFLISIIFLPVGIFPLAILRHYRDWDPLHAPENEGVLIPYGLIYHELERHQKYAFYLGWVMWYVSGQILANPRSLSDGSKGAVYFYGYYEYDPGFGLVELPKIDGGLCVRAGVGKAY